VNHAREPAPAAQNLGLVQIRSGHDLLLADCSQQNEWANAETVLALNASDDRSLSGGFRTSWILEITDDS
jgi:hypothetical protein